jgi:GrpB-like predicted nucleotidyltransferase (UPF0157 family)
MKRYPHQPLTQTNYDPAWVGLYQEEEKKIEEKLGSFLVRIEHIGSTSIPGLSGKPIIDVFVVVDSKDSAEKCLSLLEDLNYEYMDKPDQYYLRKSTGETIGFHIHMTTSDNKFWRERIAFRNYLLSHPETRKEYLDLKQSLIKRFGYDKNAYREGKNDFMTEITNRALEEYKNL